MHCILMRDKKGNYDVQLLSLLYKVGICTAKGIRVELSIFQAEKTFQRDTLSIFLLTMTAIFDTVEV